MASHSRGHPQLTGIDNTGFGKGVSPSSFPVLFLYSPRQQILPLGCETGRFCLPAHNGHGEAKAAPAWHSVGDAVKHRVGRGSDHGAISAIPN